MKHWICYVEGTDGGERFRHCSLDSARIEAERLARLTGNRVHVYEWKGSCEAEIMPVNWDTPELIGLSYGIKFGRLPIMD